jgi:uncharacterized protein
MTTTRHDPYHRLRSRMLGAAVLTLLGAGIAAPAARADDQAERIARATVNDLAARNLAGVVARFTPEMAQALPLAALEKTWRAILDQGGAVRSVEPPRGVRTAPSGVAVVTVPLKLERLALDVNVAVAQDKVAGLFFQPAPVATAPWTAPRYVDPASFTTVEVTVGPTALGGTLALPKSDRKVAAVILIQGSGPNDRDETIGPNRPFRDIAEGLASRGIATLRFDKRTKVHPELFTSAFTVREEVIDDVLAAIALLRQRPEIDPRRIIIAGHSLGGTLAPRIVQAEPAIAAAVILAGATRPLPTLMAEQVGYIASLHGPVDDAARQKIDELKHDAALALAAKPGDVGPPIIGVPPAYWGDLNAYDPAATAAKLAIPLLILHGGRDYQVTAADLARFKTALAGHPNATIRELPRLNHLFMAGDGPSRPEEYARPDHVDSEIIDAIATFVAGLGK